MGVMKLTKKSHSCVRLEKDGRTLVLDPGGFSEEDAAVGADAILVTHEHPDHFDERRLRAAMEADPAAEIWTRDGLDRRTRSVITLTALVAGGHLDELRFHTTAALRNGLSPAEIKEVLLQTAIYCGVPAANAAFKVAAEVIREETRPQE